MSKARLGVLLSGRGSNFLAIHRAIEAGELPAEIAVVLSDQPDAPGLARAEELGLRAYPVPVEGLGGQQEAAVLGYFHHTDVEWVCLAGYMRILSAELVGRYPRRIVNIHPSLLPAFPGLHAQRQALEYGVRVAGCTVHLVDEGVDTGPIVMQRTVPVKPGDTESSLAARILEQEHQVYPEALRRLLQEPWRMVGRRLVFEARTAHPSP